MNKAVKYILIGMTLIIGLLALAILGDWVLRTGQRAFSGDQGLTEDEIIAFCICSLTIALCVPSALFNIRSLQLFTDHQAMGHDAIEFDLLDGLDSKDETISIPIPYWVLNVLLGLWIIFMGLALASSLQENFPISNLPEGLPQYLIDLTILLLGFGLLIDTWMTGRRIRRKRAGL